MKEYETETVVIMLVILFSFVFMLLKFLWDAFPIFEQWLKNAIGY